MFIIQRLVSGIAWIALTAVGLYLLQPSLFPDFTMPAQVAPVVTPILTALWSADPHHLIGLMLTLVAAAIGIGGLRAAFSPRRRRPVVFAGPDLGPAPSPTKPRPLAERATTPSSLRLVEPDPAPAPVAEPRRLPVATPVEPVAVRPVATSRAAMLTAIQAGDTARGHDRAEDAAEHYATALETARSLAAAAPDVPVAKADVAEALSRLAGQEEAQGHIDDALGLFEEAAELRRNAAATAPEEAEPALALATALAELGDCREVRGHVSRARDLYAEAVGIAERLSWLQPEAQDRRAVMDRLKTRLEALKAELSANDDT